MLWAVLWKNESARLRVLSYEHVLDQTGIAAGTRVLDCGCGARRFARMAADREARVAGIDASEELIAIAAERVTEGEFRPGDIEALPWATTRSTW